MIEKIDLTRHAVIEASAGAGKTYTIENLVIRLLKGELYPQEKGNAVLKPVPLDKILLVTFTEKATGELKERIRTRIQERLATDTLNQAQQKNLQQALTQFERAGIFTIHGFSQKVLQQYGYETGEVGGFQVVKESDVTAQALLSLMREKWQRLDEELFLFLHSFIGVKRFQKLFSELSDKCESQGVFSPALKKSYSSDYAVFSEEARTELFSLFEKIKGLCGEINSSNLTASELFLEYESFNLNAASKKGRLAKMILPLLEWLSKDKPDFSALGRFLKSSESLSKFSETGFALLDSGWNKAQPGKNNELSPRFNTLITALTQLKESADEIFSAFVQITFSRLQERSTAYKDQYALLTYQDMILKLERALKDNPLLIEKLQGDYQYAFIDEFQDTDFTQWTIFKQIFMDKSAAGASHKIFVIGDPKQAIYGFRGADLEAYFRAKKELLAEETGAQLIELPANYRSSQSLISIFNYIFTSKNTLGYPIWFADCQEEKEPLRYLSVDFPDINRERDGKLVTPENRSALNLFSLTDEEQISGSRNRYYQFVVSEIERLVKSGDCRLPIKNGSGFASRELSYQDICVLVRSKGEGTQLEKRFRRAGIPYTFYKKSGLFATDEALELSFVFRYLLEPGEANLKQALLTIFFGFTPEDLVGELNGALGIKLQTLLDRWLYWVEKRQWAALFRSMLRDTGVLSRIQYSSDRERKFTNYLHIFEELQKNAFRDNLDRHELVAYFEAYRREELSGEEEFDLQRLESEADRVQLMTIHAAKGLEFPVVFLAGGFGVPPVHSDYYEYYNEEGQRVFDLLKQNKEGFEAEREAENKRLYYVALTRAAALLYAPYFTKLTQTGKVSSQVGPIGSFIYGAMSGLKNQTQLSVSWLSGVEQEHSNLFSGKPLDKTSSKSSELKVWLKKDLRPGDFPGLPILSFTALHQQSQESVFDNEDERPEPDSQEFNPFLELPQGAGTGSLLHELLEEMDFSLADSKERFDSEEALTLLIRAKMKRYGLLDIPLSVPAENAKEWEIEQRLASYYKIENSNWVLEENREWQYQDFYQIQRILTDNLPDLEKDSRVSWLYETRIKTMLWNTLSFAPESFGGIALKDLPEGMRRAEMDFYFPFQKDQLFTLPKENLSDWGLSFQAEGFLTGSMDLVFCWEEKFYLIDWKTNYLSAGYAPEAVAQKVEQEYKLQYQIYSLALDRWLSKNLGDYQREKHFGGVFYLFLRGLKPASQEGVFFIRPSEADFKNFKAELLGQLTRRSQGGRA